MTCKLVNIVKPNWRMHCYCSVSICGYSLDFPEGKSIAMHQQKLSGKSWLKICSSRWDCSPPTPPPPPPPPSKKLDWIHEKKFHFFFTQKISGKEILAYILLSTIIHLYQYLMKFCDETALTAVRPPPQQQKQTTDVVACHLLVKVMGNRFHSFHKLIREKPEGQKFFLW